MSLGGVAATSDLEGAFRLAGIPGGFHEVRATKGGYQAGSVSGVAVLAGAVATTEVPLKPVGADSVVRLEAFSVSAEVVQTSGVGLLSLRQKSSAVSDAISSDQMSKLGFGTAAAAMKAVTGASVVGNKYVYIRGLGERYSSTMVNGVEVPSADPDRRAVNLDMFPSELVDAIVTTKTFTPDRPGNFTGGAVDLKTKEFPEQFMLSLSVSVAVNSGVTGKDLLSTGGPANTWGRDEGGRALPGELTNQRIPLRFTAPSVDTEIGRLTRAFNPVLAPTVRSAPVNRSFAVAFGGLAQVLGRKLGYAASVSYDRSFSGYRGGFTGRYERQGVNSPALAPLVEMSDQRGEDDTLIGSLFNVA